MDVNKNSIIFIRNFVSKYNLERKLKEEFAKFGQIEQVHILETPNNEFIGYVGFTEKESANKAVEKMDDAEMPDGKNMKVGILKECNDSINNLYIKNVPNCVDDDVLESLFKKFGNIVSATIMKNYMGESRGFGFVCFEKAVDAAIAKKDMNGLQVGGKTFDISFAQKKESREAFLTAQKKGILLKTETKKMVRLPLEKRIVRPPSKSDLSSCYSVPSLQNIPPYGYMTDWHQNRLMDFAQPMYELNSSFGMLNTGNYQTERSHNDNNNNDQKQKENHKKSEAKKSKSSFKTYTSKKSEADSAKVHKENVKEQKTSNVTKDGKAVLQDILLDKLKKQFPAYATDIMSRLMNRDYKELLRLAGNYRLLYKAANSEVQKIKAAAKSTKRP
uniref:CSON010619 protein n=1 Tax=Culicoides sonorensis TaxID=179676 RepID=A0A336KHS9_CULSO